MGKRVTNSETRIRESGGCCAASGGLGMVKTEIEKKDIEKRGRIELKMHRCST